MKEGTKKEEKNVKKRNGKCGWKWSWNAGFLLKEEQ